MKSYFMPSKFIVVNLHIAGAPVLRYVSIDQIITFGYDAVTSNNFVSTIWFSKDNLLQVKETPTDIQKLIYDASK
jgi:hypothetical protein